MLFLRDSLLTHVCVPSPHLICRIGLPTELLFIILDHCIPSKAAFLSSLLPSVREAVNYRLVCSAFDELLKVEVCRRAYATLALGMLAVWDEEERTGRSELLVRTITSNEEAASAVKTISFQADDNWDVSVARRTAVTFISLAPAIPGLVTIEQYPWNQEIVEVFQSYPVDAPKIRVGKVVLEQEGSPPLRAEDTDALHRPLDLSSLESLDISTPTFSLSSLLSLIPNLTPTLKVISLWWIVLRGDVDGLRSLLTHVGLALRTLNFITIGSSGMDVSAWIIPVWWDLCPSILAVTLTGDNPQQGLTRLLPPSHPTLTVISFESPRTRAEGDSLVRALIAHLRPRNVKFPSLVRIVHLRSANSPEVDFSPGTPFHSSPAYVDWDQRFLEVGMSLIDRNDRTRDPRVGVRRLEPGEKEFWEEQPPPAQELDDESDESDASEVDPDALYVPPDEDED